MRCRHVMVGAGIAFSLLLSMASLVTSWYPPSVPAPVRAKTTVASTLDLGDRLRGIHVGHARVVDPEIPDEGRPGDVATIDALIRELKLQVAVLEMQKAMMEATAGQTTDDGDALEEEEDGIRPDLVSGTL